MKTDHLKEIISWIKTTDLIEVSFKDGAKGFSFSSAGEAQAPHFPIPPSRYRPVCAPAVGIFQWSELGRARKAEEGAAVSEGDVLGVIEKGKGAVAQVLSPCAGRVARVMVEGGGPVEYGQPLLFIET
ncbi:MAG: hypothetical protein HY921_02905 [Elusimicrobia bacterium]|nr:hypothetical protein [Elusimicrobiota bacterium]